MHMPVGLCQDLLGYSIVNKALTGLVRLTGCMWAWVTCLINIFWPSDTWVYVWFCSAKCFLLRCRSPGDADLCYPFFVIAVVSHGLHHPQASSVVVKFSSKYLSKILAVMDTKYVIPKVVSIQWTRGDSYLQFTL